MGHGARWSGFEDHSMDILGALDGPLSSGLEPSVVLCPTLVQKYALLLNDTMMPIAASIFLRLRQTQLKAAGGTVLIKQMTFAVERPTQQPCLPCPDDDAQQVQFQLSSKLPESRL